MNCLIHVILFPVFLAAFAARVPASDGFIDEGIKIIDSGGDGGAIKIIESGVVTPTLVAKDGAPAKNGSKIAPGRNSGAEFEKRAPSSYSFHETAHKNPLVKMEEEVNRDSESDSDPFEVEKGKEFHSVYRKMAQNAHMTEKTTVPSERSADDSKLALESVPRASQVHPMLVKTLPVNSTESNDISQPTLASRAVSGREALKPAPGDKRLDNGTPTSVPPKHKSKSTADKQPEAKINSIEDEWRDLEKKFRSYTDTVMKKALPKFLRIHSQLNISSQCNGALMQMAYGLRNLKSWAIKMVDASGRLPSGSLDGTLTDLGDYDQCLDVAQPKRSHHNEIKGQYCTLELKPILPALQNSVTLNTKVLDFGDASKDSVFSDLSRSSALFHFMVMRIGICVPSPCVADDIRELAATLLKKVPVEVFVRNCETKQKVHISIPQFIVMFASAIIGLLIIAGTCIDGYVQRNLSKSEDIGRVPQSLLAFSLHANIRHLFKTSKRSSALTSVNGIRCLSLMWIVLAHTYGFGHRQGLARLSHAKTYMDDVLFQIITNAWVSVDTFFLLGGLLAAYSNLKMMANNGGSINFLSHVFHRFWRLTPPLAGTLGVMFLLPLVGSGPLWPDMVGQKVANCQKRWWQVFLPMNTWIDFGSMCLLHTWYIAADIHFYCFAPVALIVLYRWPAFGFALLFLLTAACSLVTGLLTIINDLPPTVIFFSPDVELTKRTANLIYFRPYPHIGAYCVGLALGYILWRYRKFSLSKIYQGAGWVLSSGSCLAVLFATYSWSRGQSADPAEGVVYAVLHRTVWAAGVAWVVFACATGHGGLLNKFLSWKVFGPLSKLCYSVYLLHFPVLWVRVSWRRSLLNFHHYDIVTEFFGILMITLGLSVIFHLTFEAPFLKLEQIWFSERGKSSKMVKQLDDKTST